MATNQRYQDGVLREQWTNATQPTDATPAGYTAWNATGTVTTSRALNGTESAALAAQDTSTTAITNQTTLQQKAQQALAANATFQAIASPTNAQNAAQVQALTKQCNGIIRLLLGVTDSTGGT